MSNNNLIEKGKKKRAQEWAEAAVPRDHHLAEPLKAGFQSAFITGYIVALDLAKQLVQEHQALIESYDILIDALNALDKE